MDNVIIDYGIMAGEDHFQLAGMVNQQIKNGWQPYYNVFERAHGEQLLLCQAMVKYNLKKKTNSQ